MTPRKSMCSDSVLRPRVPTLAALVSPKVLVTHAEATRTKEASARSWGRKPCRCENARLIHVAAEPLEAAAGSELAGRMARLRRLLPSSTGSPGKVGAARPEEHAALPQRVQRIQPPVCWPHEINVAARQLRPQACHCPARGLRRARSPPRQPRAESSPRHHHRPQQLTADQLLPPEEA